MMSRSETSLSGTAPDLTIAVATYDRPQRLVRTLRSLFAQENRLGLSIEILIVDNHPSQNGAPVVAELAPSSPWPMRHVSELARNMSRVRNRAFEAAAAPLVAFIDDDEAADPDWTDELVGALRRSGAAIAVGPRLAEFAAGAPPAWDPTGAQFARDLHLPDGALVELTAASGKPRYGLGTGNSLFDLRRCFGDGEAMMRVEFGDAGGEDAELFVRLHRNGRPIVWAARARVTEIVETHRTSPAYRLLRVRRETQHYVSIYLDGARRPALAWSILMLKGIAQLMVGCFLSLLLVEFWSISRIRGRLIMAHGLGKLRWRRAVGFISEPSGASIVLNHGTIAASDRANG